MNKIKPGTKTIAQRVNKSPLWAFKAPIGSKNRHIEDTQLSQFSELLYSKLKGGHTLEREQVGRLVQTVIGKQFDISSTSIGRWISAARGWFIKEYNETIIYLSSNQAYKIAQGAEKPARVAKLGHMALRWKYRFLSETTILNEDDRKIAGASIIDRLKKDMGTHDVKQTEMLLDSSKSDMKLLRIEAKNAA